MKRILSSLNSSILVLVTISLSLLPLNVSAQPMDLSGTYTVDPAGGAFNPPGNNNFISIAEAVDSLISRGVGGAVILDIADGTYDGAYTLTAIPGASSSFTVTFQSASADSSNVFLSHNGMGSGSERIILLDGATYITFKQLTFDATGGNSGYGQAFWIQGGTNHIDFLNNSFIGKTSGSSSVNDRRALIASWESNDDEFLTFRQNRFTFGERGIIMSGTSGLSSGIVIEDNEFYDQLESAIYLRYMEAPIVRDNYINITGYDRKSGITFYDVDKAFQITGNTIRLLDCYAGIYINACDGAPGQDGLVANNFVSNSNNGGSSNIGIWVTGTSKYIRFYHNSVYMKDNGIVNSRCFTQESGGNNLDLRNNVFLNRSYGYPIAIANGTAFTTLNNNGYFTNGNFIARWGSTDLADLSDLQASSGDNAASVFADPWFNSINDLHTTNFRIEGKGANLTGIVADDIDGDPRSSTPDLGADEFTGAGTPLAGEYFIGGSSPDFATISEAVDSLNEVGISAPVTFSIRDDDSPYDEVVLIRSISGSGPSNTFTLRADPSNTGDVVLTHDGATGGNNTVHYQRVSNATLKNLTIAAQNSSNSTVIRFNGHCTNDSIVGCTINSLGSSSNNGGFYSADDLLSDIYIVNNDFSGGYRGIYIDGFSAASQKPDGLEIHNNTFSGHYYSGMYLRDCNAPVIRGNDLSPGASTSNYWGIWLDYCSNDYEIMNNRVRSSVDDGGIAVGNSTSTSTFRGKIINNFVQINGTEALSGIAILTCSYVDVYFNTSRIENTNSGSNAFYANSGSEIRLRNNVFANSGDGRSMQVENTGAITESDYNDLFTTGTNLVRWGGTELHRLSEYQTSSSLDANSLDVNPWFLAADDPTINSSFLDNIGQTISGITSDYFGIVRSNPPDIGAAEFTASANPVAAGIYTIGGTTPDYNTVKEALADLQLRGVSGQVTLNVRDGEYNEYIGRVFNIPGATASDSIVLQSESLDPAKVRIYYVTDDVSPRLFHLESVDYLTIQHLTLSAQGASTGRPITISGTFRGINIYHNILTSANTTNAVLYAGGILDDLRIVDNLVSKGYRGIGVDGDQYRYATNVEITGNFITGSNTQGIGLNYHFSPHVLNNTIENTLYSGFEGISLINCSDELVVSGNRINNTNTDYGMIFSICKATNPFYGLVSNNFVTVGGTSTANGIYVNDCARLFIYHNSINITSTNNGSGRGIYTKSNNSEIGIMNNSIANTGAAYALVVEDPSDISSNYNDLYSSAGKTAWWNNTTYATLADWQAASGQDANSISVNPMYLSSSELYSQQPGLHQKATPLTQVAIDIDSVPRDPSKPDIGAAEFTCVTPTFNVWTSPTCFGDSTMIIDSSMNIAPGSTRGWDFTGDLIPDVFSENDFDTIIWHFTDTENTEIGYAVSQIAGCQDFELIEADIIPAPVLQITTKGAYCDTNDGWANVSVTNIPGPFSYFWSDGQSDSLATGLALGTITVAVTNPTGCTRTEEVEIAEAIQVTVTQTKASSCGVADGSAMVSATGGFGPYNYVWENGETSETNGVLSPGPHYVNVIDSKGCFSTGSINITSEGGPQISAESLKNNDCFGGHSGSINITISGGATPYGIQWSNGETGEDLDSLAAGIYNVLVSDADGCLGSASFQIYQPSMISISPVVEDATCDGSDGTAVAVVSGGTEPYIYSWSSGGIYEIENGLAAGVYSVAVTDARGCTNVSSVLVNNVGAPDVTVTSVEGVGCTVTDNGAVNITVNPPNPFYTYAWSNGETTSSISGLEAGSYELTVTDQSGCKGVAQATVRQEPPEINPICLVTVDTTTGTNQVIWEKLDTTDVSHYNIYRESSTKGDFQLIGIVGADEESLFTDDIADPTIRSWRYRISVVDRCGNESAMSPYHKTMHLTMNVGLDDAVNLLWDHYEGFKVPTYEIWRYESAGGWSNVTNLPSNLTSYTDAAPPKEDLTYFIEVDHPTGCTSNDKKASTLNSSRSNRKGKLKSEGPGSVEDLLRDRNFSVYPNPGDGMYNLSLDLEGYQNVGIKVFDISGKLVKQDELLNVPFRLETRLDLSGEKAGIYQLHIRTDDMLIHRILIKK